MGGGKGEGGSGILRSPMDEGRTWCALHMAFLPCVNVYVYVYVCMYMYMYMHYPVSLMCSCVPYVGTLKMMMSDTVDNSDGHRIMYNYVWINKEVWIKTMNMYE